MALCRFILALLLCANFFAASAQAPAESREAKLKRANKESTEAIELTRQNDLKLSPAAIAKLQKAEAIYLELQESEKLLFTVILIGNLQLGLAQTDAAIATLSRALSLARELKKAEQEIRMLAGLGEYFFKAGKTSTENKSLAKDYLEQAAAVIDRAEPKPDPLSYQVYELLGDVWISLYNPSDAQKAYLKALSFKKNKPPEESIGAIITYAKRMIDIGAPKIAVGPLMDAGRRAVVAKLPKLESLVAWYIADLMAGKFRDLPLAKKYLDRTEQLLKTNPDEALRSKLDLSWGKYYFANFDLIKSDAYFIKAYNPEASIQPAGIKGEVLLHAGILNFTIGSYEAAIALLEVAVKTNEAEGRKLMEMESLRYLARSQNALGRVAEAQKTMGKAMTARGQSGQGWFSSESIAVLIDNSDFLIESFQKETGTEPLKDVRLSRAKNYLELALSNATREKMLEYKAIAAQRLAVVHSLRGDSPKAIDLLNDALITSRSAGLPVQEATSMTGLMDLSSAMGNTGAATFYGKSAVNVYQQLRKRIADVPPEARAAYLKTIEGTYRKLASLLIEQGRIAEAEQVLTMLKEEELIEYVRRDDGVARSMLEKLALTEEERSAITRYDVIANRITSLGKELDELEKERRTPGEFQKQKRYDELRAQLADASTVFQKFLEGLKLKFGSDSKRVDQVASGLKSTLAELKATRTAAVTTIVGEDTLNIIVTTSKTQRAHTIKVTAKTINDLIAKFRIALTSPQYDPRPVSQKLYDLIVKPIEGDLAGINADTILWSLDGTLRYLPPAALWDSKNGYLAERFSNVMVNLASRGKLMSRNTGPEQRTVLGVGVSKATDGFAPLDAVPDELDCIVADKTVGMLSAKPQCTNGVLTGRKLLDEKFTLANFEGELGRYPIIHIASHFKLTPGDDKNSFLLLGGGENRKFTVEKLRNQPLTDVELIVLSACNTATPGGTKANGIEIEGFGAAAQEEGARAVLATLWAVADTSTKDFMVEFYRLYGKEGVSKSDAVRSAQLKLMYGKYRPTDVQKRRAELNDPSNDGTLPKYIKDENAPFAHPFYWSPFILIGNWK